MAGNQFRWDHSQFQVEVDPASNWNSNIIYLSARLLKPLRITIANVGKRVESCGDLLIGYGTRGTN